MHMSTKNNNVRRKAKNTFISIDMQGLASRSPEMNERAYHRNF